MGAGARIRKILEVTLAVGMLWVTFASAGEPPDSKADTKAVSTDDSPVVARVYGKEIHMSELDARIGNEAFELEKKLFVLRKQALDDMLTSIVLSNEAEKRGETLEQLVETVGNSTPAPDPSEVERQFAENRPGLSDWGEAIGRYRVFLELQATGRAQAVQKFVSELKGKAGMQTLLQEPSRDLHLASTKCQLGNESAPVQLVEFIDYDCPFCKKLESSLASIMQSQGPAVHLVIKQLPLPIHKTARQAALAATCAAGQNKFAGFHEKLLAASDHTEAALLQLGKESGLNPIVLSKCMSSEEAKHQIEMDVADARTLGVEATPSLFLNGAKVDYTDGDDLVRQVSAKIQYLINVGKTEVAGGNR